MVERENELEERRSQLSTHSLQWFAPVGARYAQLVLWSERHKNECSVPGLFTVDLTTSCLDAFPLRICQSPRRRAEMHLLVV